jgi:serine/threonine protein kinase
MNSNLPNLEGKIYFKFLGSIVLKNYKIIEKIGAGAFGEIYKAENQNINN